MRILLAEDEGEKGELDKAAPRLLDVLRARIRMYVSKHAPFVRLPRRGSESMRRLEPGRWGGGRGQQAAAAPSWTSGAVSCSAETRP